MAWYNKLAKSIEIKREDTIEENKTPVVKPEPEEWVWVEGYKGLDKNMQGYNEFQYELGTEYTADGEPEVCSNGFHFCLNLKDVFGYQNCLGRFFKVKAYVKKKDYDRYGELQDPRGWVSSRIDKLAAKKIILIEEITDTDANITSRIYDQYPYIKTADDIKQARTMGYEKFVVNMSKEMLSKYFSELFVELFVNTHLYVITSSGSRFTSESTLMKKTAEIIAYMEEGVSKDVAIYLLMK